MVLCDECLKPIIGDKFVFNPDKNDGKKFCSKVCAEKYYRTAAVEAAKKINWTPWIVG
ncbi:hypothetical protein [endosymbiont GvMRE of Glomus versiforme]|uniref:hypothetical protein n=1 Tax=endosymbiont GvMRE of Glomus versiforme TaxID=2039283 RepID=UPI000ECC9181|nr:hypothetical protein [endosymbiont GvMRE of Glomus versiforme]RHZ36380.1 hypothetical protein GvMRE_Ic1g217 [endosymbiont GvMRE of Glomus versiforme]